MPEIQLISAKTGQVVGTFWEDDPVPAPDPIPSTISRFQARAALMDAGLLADAEIAVGAADPITQLAWAEATEWRRDSPTIAAIAAALDLAEADVDALFVSAALIRA